MIKKKRLLAVEEREEEDDENDVLESKYIQVYIHFFFFDSLFR